MSSTQIQQARDNHTLRWGRSYPLDGLTKLEMVRQTRYAFAPYKYYFIKNEWLSFEKIKQIVVYAPNVEIAYVWQLATILYPGALTELPPVSQDIILSIWPGAIPTYDV